MKLTFSIIILLSITCQVFGQTDSFTMYKNLETIKVYAFSYSSSSSISTDKKKGTYKVNGKKVSKSKFEKHKEKIAINRKNIRECRPCLLELYDEKHKLIRESVACTDCGVGWFKTYYKNGRVKLSGSYKENPTNDWTNIYSRGYCSVKNGQWTYFNKKGDTLYSEFWDNGLFIKQVPEQNNTVIWDVQVKLDSQNIDTLIIPADNIGDLTIESQYKNSNTDSKITITFEVSAIGHVPNKKEFTLESFKEINVSAMLAEAGIPKNKKTTYTLEVFSDGKLVKRIHPNIKK